MMQSEADHNEEIFVRDCIVWRASWDLEYLKERDEAAKPVQIPQYER